MLLPITLGQATWRYQFYLLHIWGFTREKKVCGIYLRKTLNYHKVVLVSFVQFLQPHNVVILPWNEMK